MAHPGTSVAVATTRMMRTLSAAELATTLGGEDKVLKIDAAPKVTNLWGGWEWYGNHDLYPCTPTKDPKKFLCEFPETWGAYTEAAKPH